MTWQFLYILDTTQILNQTTTLTHYSTGQSTIDQDYEVVTHKHILWWATAQEYHGRRFNIKAILRGGEEFRVTNEKPRVHWADFFLVSIQQPR